MKDRPSKNGAPPHPNKLSTSYITKTNYNINNDANIRISTEYARKTGRNYVKEKE
jgi:hypothetical protein